MNKTLAALAAVLLATAFTTPVDAREGTTSQKSGGIKCYQVLVPQADGTTKLTQVCRKGI